MLDALLRADATARAWLSAYHAPLLDLAAIWLSRAGSGGLLWWVGGLVVALRRPRLAGAFVQLVLALVLASLVTGIILKPLVGRMRPYEGAALVQVIGSRPASPSFPSGHAANAFAGAYALARMLPAARLPIWTAAAAVACSRVYLGLHYPLDVVAGALIGLACGLFAVGGTRWNAATPPAQTPSEQR